MTRRFDVVTFHGHPLIQAKHRTTFEITTDEEITRRGDCIIGIKSNKACADLDTVLKSLLRSDQTKVKLTLIVNAMKCEILGKGSKKLSLKSTRGMVARTSCFISDKTFAVNCNFASKDLPRAIIETLKNPNTVGRLIISV